VGEEDALVLVDHLERAGATEHASPWYVRAVQAAAAAGDFGTALAVADRGLLNVDESPERTELLGLTCTPLIVTGRVREALSVALRVLSQLAPGSAPWAGALLAVASAAMVGHDISEAAPHFARLVSMSIEASVEKDIALCLFFAVMFASGAGQPALAAAALSKLDQIVAQSAAATYLVAFLRLAKAEQAMWDARWLPMGAENAREAVRISTEMGHGWLPQAGAFFLVPAFVALGDLETARSTLASGGWIPVHAPLSSAWTALLAVADNDRAGLDAARDETAGRSMPLRTRVLLALGYADAGRVEEAAAIVRQIPKSVERLRGFRADFHMARARVALARQDGVKALSECDAGDEAAERWGCWIATRDLLALSRAEALLLLARRDEAQQIMMVLRSRLLDLAFQMDAPTRIRFLARGFPTARIVRAANDVLGPTMMPADHG
jgi:hypothetical protein